MVGKKAKSAGFYNNVEPQIISKLLVETKLIVPTYCSWQYDTPICIMLLKNW